MILLIKSNCSRVKPSPSRLPLLSVRVMVAPGPEAMLLVDDIDDVVEVGDNRVTPVVFKGTFKAFNSSSVNARPVAASTTVPPFERYVPKQVAPSGELASPTRHVNGGKNINFRFSVAEAEYDIRTVRCGRR